ncbi:MAG: hypothetical protein VX026_07030 [Myxococcota bacterium]|nr:hypothetical protein [Myxococcota bacterium]
MKRLLLLTLGMTLAACPTPPEEIPQQAGPGAGGAPPGGGNAGPGGPPPEGGTGPGGPPPGEGGQPAEGGPDMAPQGEVPMPEGEGPGPDMAPQGEAPGPDAPPQGEGPGPDAPPQGEEPGPDAPPEGEGTEGEGANNTPPPNNVPESGPPEGGMIENAILVKVDRVPPGANNPQQTQEEIGAGQFVTFSGTADCSDCSGDLLLRVNKFLGPNQVPSQSDLLTQTKLDGTGSFSIKVPTSDVAVSLELLVDEDSSGGPSQGERFAVLELGGTLTPNEDRSGISLDATDREVDNPGFFGQ